MKLFKKKKTKLQKYNYQILNMQKLSKNSKWKSLAQHFR